MERAIKLIPFRVHKYCPKCTGTMESCSHGVIMSNGAGNNTITISGKIAEGILSQSFSSQSFNHRCNKYGHGENYDKRYPYVDYREDGNME